MSQPTFTKECIDAYNSMTTQESPNDYFVCDFGENNQLTLVETGKGGMERVKEILRESYQAKTAICMFRITAIDDRENTVSYRTKLVHVIYTGPKTPVMKRSKVGTFNKAFKEPFTSNLAIQTDDVDGDLAEAPIERSLRASGGAHAPSRYDFTNTSAPGSDGAAQPRKGTSPAASPAAKPPTPVAAAAAPKPPTPVAAAKPVVVAPPAPVYASAEEVMKKLGEKNAAFDVEGVLECYSEDSEVVHIDATERATRAYQGLEDIKSFYTWWYERVNNTAQRTVAEEVKGSIGRVDFDVAEVGVAHATSTCFVDKGKVLLNTFVTVDAVASGAEDDAAFAAVAAVAVGEVVAEALDEAPAEDAPAEEEAPAEEAPAEEEAQAE